MKINYITNSRIPTERAHGIQIMKMCEAFARQGCEVELIVPKRRNRIHENPFAFYNVQKCFKITYLPTLDLVGIVPRVGFLLQSFIFLFAAKRYLRAKTGLIYSRDLFTNFFFKKTVLEIHTLPRKITFIHTYLYSKSKLLIVLTKTTREHLLERVNTKILIAPDGVDLNHSVVMFSKDEARTRVGLPHNKTIVMYTGHLYAWKGINTFFEAMTLLDNNFLGVIVGGTPEDIDHYLRKSIVPKNINIIGAVKHLKVPEYLKAADIVILPNSGRFKISRWYTSPLKLFEYMASGTPIVASELPSIREIINEDNAFFFEPDNSKSLADTILTLIRHRDDAKVKSNNALDVVKKYTWEKRARHVLDVL